MALPINKQPVVRPGNKVLWLGFPFHGKVSQAGTLPTDGVLTLTPPASPPTKTFPDIRELVTEQSLTTFWYIGWNVTNTSKTQRPGWVLPTRSAEQLSLDTAKGYNWKPYMTFAGPRGRWSGSTSFQPLEWDRWVYIDGNGQAYVIQMTIGATAANQVEFIFRVSELVWSVTRAESTWLRVVGSNILSQTNIGTQLFKFIIVDRAPTGNHVLIQKLFSAPALAVDWDTGSDLPRGFSIGGGSVSEFTCDYEINVTGNGLANIAFTVTTDPFDEKAASFMSTPNPNASQSQIIGFFYDDAGVRKAITQSSTSVVSNLGTNPPATPDNYYTWTVDSTFTVDWGGLYSAFHTEQTTQVASFGPYTNTQNRFVGLTLVDSDTSTINPGLALTYNNVTNVFEQTGGPGTVQPNTARTLLNPHLGAGGERFVRIALGFLQTTGDPNSGAKLYDVWLDKKNGNVVASPSGWAGGVAGFYEFAAFDPETGTFDSTVYAAGALPVQPAAFPLKYYA